MALASNEASQEICNGFLQNSLKCYKNLVCFPWRVLKECLKKCVEEINQLVVQETMKQVHYLVV